ncbi:heat shock protein 40 [Tribonema minus]|uniref:Heat shock protein 40 n=1 Tax=Tribonema minus TaxID=303371 RepID=A0A835ZCK1_9STRA|nr:heat shock protein 40 [Tribonema minus]
MGVLACLLLLLGALAVAAARDFYAILGLKKTASDSEIKKAYRQLSLKYHPDKNKSEDAATHFAEVASAYEVLSDPDKRSTYDNYGEEGLKQQEQQRGSGGRGDAWDNFFGDFGGFPGQRARDEVPRTANVEVPLRVSLRQLYSGDAFEASFVRQVMCLRAAECEKRCPECMGPGVAMRTQKIAPGFVQQIQMRDDRCVARGKCWNKRCTACPNGPTEPESVPLTVEVQKGMQDGEHIVFEESADEAAGHKPGDLVLTIDTLPHAEFARHGDDLFMEMDIDLLDALVGFETGFAHLDGRRVPVKQTGVTAPGTTRVLSGEGMPRRNPRGQGSHGDLTIRFNVVFPKHLSPDQQRSIREVLGAATAAAA